DEIEEVPGVIAIQAGAAFVFGDGLVRGKVHLAALDCFAFDFVPGIAKWGEDFVFRVVHENVAVSEVEHTRAASRIAVAIPFRVPKLVANLESDDRLAGTRGEREKNALLALKNGADRAVDGDFLIIAGRFP